jgi:hypothetical protein
VSRPDIRRLIFVGDVSLASSLPAFPEVPWDRDTSGLVINLEGGLTSRRLDGLPVWNRVDLFDAFVSEHNVVCVSLANNHVLDDVDQFDFTLDHLREIGLPAIGVGPDVDPWRPTVGGVKLSIAAAGWSGIGCVTDGTSVSVTALDEHLLAASVHHERALGRQPIVVAHWCYEGEVVPQPEHRYLARRLADAGCRAIVGHHPHRVGSYELLNTALVAYSVGNWAFDPSEFGLRDLRPTEIEQHALEWDPVSETATVHVFRRAGDAVVFSHTTSPTELCAPFAGLSDQQYYWWYRRHRSSRRTLPVYGSRRGESVGRRRRKLLDHVVRGHDKLARSAQPLAARWRRG